MTVFQTASAPVVQENVNIANEIAMLESNQSANFTGGEQIYFPVPGAVKLPVAAIEHVDMPFKNKAGTWKKALVSVYGVNGVINDNNKRGFGVVETKRRLKAGLTGVLFIMREAASRDVPELNITKGKERYFLYSE